MNRITLALAACEGLTDEELAQRGAGGFKKMIERKREYATRSHAKELSIGILKIGLRTSSVVVAKLQDELAKAHMTIQTLESLNEPVTHVTDATKMLEGIIKH